MLIQLTPWQATIWSILTPLVYMACSHIQRPPK